MDPPSAPKKRLIAKTSEVWTHFRDLQGGVVECNACKHKITRHGKNVASSVQMWLHLRCKHKDVFAATEYYKRRQAVYASQQATSTTQAPNGEGRSPFYREGSRFDAQTTLKLEKFYKQQTCPTLETRRRLAARWNVPVLSISRWFFKRKQKERLFSKKPPIKPSKATTDDDDVPVSQEIQTEDIKQLRVHSVGDLLIAASQSVTGPKQSDSSGNNGDNAVVEAKGSGPLSEPGGNTGPAATGFNLGTGANAIRPGILKRRTAGSNTASAAARAAFATPPSAERKKVKFNGSILRAQSKAVCGPNQLVAAVGRSSSSSSAATAPSSAPSGPINASARPSSQPIPRVAQTTHVRASADEDIVEASGQAAILRLKKIYEKSHASFLRALRDVDNAIFKHEMSIA